MGDDNRCQRRGPVSGGQCSKVWWNEHPEHHSLDTGERWTDADAERLREERSERKKALTDAVWDLVIIDMGQRDKLGVERYGKRLAGATPIDPLQYAYEEALDLACYLRKMIYERDDK